MDKAGEREGEGRKAGGERQAARKERLAAALRENLRRRKAQARAREEGRAAGGTGRHRDPS